MKRTLQRHKNKIYPKIPKTLEDIRNSFLDPKILNEYGYNLTNSAQFYIDTVIETNHAFTVFASKFVIDFIQKNIEPGQRNYLLDGTFDRLPGGGYYQLLIITIEFENQVCQICKYLKVFVTF